MIEIALLAVIGLLSGLLIWEKYEGRKERNKLVNALIAKNAQDMVNLDLADKTEIKAQVPDKPEFVPLDDLTNEEFGKLI